MIDVQAIERAVKAAETANYGAWLGDGPWNAPTQEALYGLAVACGVPAASVAQVSDKDLSSLYAVARKKADSAPQVGARIARKYGLEPVTPAFDPFAGVPLPSPVPGVSPDELRAAVSDAVQAAMAPVHDMTSTRLQMVEGLARALPGQVADQVAAAIAALAPVQVTVTRPAAEPVALGTVHKATPRILRALAAGLNVYLHGPAGSGKTTAGRKCAEALGVPFYTAAKVESEYLLLGFKDARGETVRTQFREAYEHGGVFLFDELDASAPGAVVALNMALANGICPFPDGNVQRHQDFYCIAAGNTKLTGANRQYVGRSQLDAASVDRFYFLEFGYDNALELSIASNRAWALHVQAVRAAIEERGLNHLVTPRATFDGCKALAAGDTWEEAEQACIFKGLDADTIDQIKRAVVRTGTAGSAAA